MFKCKPCRICQLNEAEAMLTNASSKLKRSFWLRRVVVLYQQIVSYTHLRSLHLCSNEQCRTQALAIREAVRKLDIKKYKRRLAKVMKTIDDKIELEHQIKIKRKLALPVERLETELQRINFLLGQRSRRLRETGPQDADAKAFIEHMAQAYIKRISHL